MCVGVCVYARVHVRACLCMRVFVYARVRVFMRVHART